MEQEYPSGQNDSSVLEEVDDPDHSPTIKEIQEYAAYLGMDPFKDKEYFYIAKEGLKMALPKQWKPCRTKSGEIYYLNFQTGEKKWEHPYDWYFREKFQQAKKLKEGKKKYQIPLLNLEKLSNEQKPQIQDKQLDNEEEKLKLERDAHIFKLKQEYQNQLDTYKWKLKEKLEKEQNQVAKAINDHYSGQLKALKEKNQMILNQIIKANEEEVKKQEEKLQNQIQELKKEYQRQLQEEQNALQLQLSKQVDSRNQMLQNKQSDQSSVSYKLQKVKDKVSYIKELTKL